MFIQRTVKEGKCRPDRESPVHTAKDRSKEMISWPNPSCSKWLEGKVKLGFKDRKTWVR